MNPLPAGSRPGVTFSPDELWLVCRLVGVPPLCGPATVSLRRAGAALAALAARGHLTVDESGRTCVVGAVAATVRLATGAELHPTGDGTAVAVGAAAAVVVSTGRFGTVRLEPVSIATALEMCADRSG